MMMAVRKQRDLLQRLEAEIERGGKDKQDLDWEIKEEERRWMEVETDRQKQEQEGVSVENKLLSVRETINRLEGVKSRAMSAINTIGAKLSQLDEEVEVAIERVVRTQTVLGPLYVEVERKDTELDWITGELLLGQTKLGEITSNIRSEEKGLSTANEAIQQLEWLVRERGISISNYTGTPAADSPVLPWLVGSVLFNLALGGGFLLSDSSQPTHLKNLTSSSSSNDLKLEFLSQTMNRIQDGTLQGSTIESVRLPMVTHQTQGYFPSHSQVWFES